VAALALLAVPATASDFALFGAYQDTDDANEGLGVGGRLRFNYFELRATYFDDVTSEVDFGGDDCPPDCVENDDFDLKFVPLEAGLVFKFAETDRFRWFIGGGAGYYIIDTDFAEVDDEVGYYGVIGTDIFFGGNFGMTIEGMYRNMEATVRQADSDDVDVDEEVDIQLGGIGANVGLVWRF
jgi:hypothetical protein